MSEIEALPTSLCWRILNHLGMSAQPPRTLETLRQLVASYTGMAPWESASRIQRRARHEEASDCAILGADFWESHFEAGTGGTCYESNYAFFGLLRWLGYEGYLTINDMDAAIGCHSAIVVLIDGRKYLVDVGFPLYTIIAINGDQETSAECPIMNYRLIPQGGSRYQLWRELRTRVHGFTLRDEPVAEADYRAIAIHDYRHDGGQFLDAIVIHKVVEGQLWRFHSDVQPFVLQEFVNGERRDHAMGDDAAAELAEKFGIARDVVAAAMRVLGIAGS